MRVFGWALLWAFLGLVAGYAAAIGIGIVLFEVFSVSQREGAAAMGLVFVIGPMVACLAALIAGIIAAVTVSRRARRRSDGTVAPRAPMRRGLRAAIGAVLGFAGGYGAAVVVLAAFYSLRGTPYFSSHAWAYAAAWAPFIAGALGAGFGLWLVLGRKSA